MVHGGVDGYSRTIVYLRAADNNRATTVLSAFQSAVAAYGLPSRVRSDFGGENVDVWTYVAECHHNSSSVITGSSTHNERVERLWRDTNRCVGSVFKDLFYELEEENKLDPLNEIDTFCLLFTKTEFIPSCISRLMEQSSSKLSKELDS